jgi:NAD-dependent deacetylase
MTDDDRVASLAAEVRGADSTVAFTGAGVSTASGIPDFRGEDGLWTRYDVEDFHVRRLRADPAGFWTDRLDLAEELRADADPNPAHEALARLERAGHLDAVVTQNVDGLHRAAGSDEVVKLHGNGSRVVCTDCGDRFDAEPVRERVREGERPPRCDCGGLLKPDVVLFGERLPEAALLRARALAEGADVFLAVGSSLTVEPAAGLPRRAAADGATLAVANLDETPFSGRATYDLRADVTDVLPRLADAVV